MYNGMLYFKYQNDIGKRFLAKYNGTLISIIQNLNTNDYGIDGTPFEYNGNLYFSYQNSSNKYQLAKFNGSNISLINNTGTASYGVVWSPMIYNNKLFFGYKDSTNHSFLANYDGNNLNIIPNPDTSKYGFQNNLIVYNQSIYFNYRKYDLTYYPPLTSRVIMAKYDGNNISFINNSDYPFFAPILYKNNLLVGLSYLGVKMGTHWVTSALIKLNANDNGSVIGGTYNDFSPYHNYGYQGSSILYNDCIYFINNTLYSSNAIGKYDNITVKNILSPNVSNINYFGTPIILNNKLFYCFEEANNISYLSKYDGYSFEKITNQQIADKGVKGNLIVFNNNLYFQYQNASNKFQLAKYIDTILNTPAIFDVSNGGTYLSCTSGSTVKLSGSQTNTMYYLYKNNILIDSLPGTANELVWYNKTIGTYTVKAKNAIGTMHMNGGTTISIVNYAPATATVIKGLKNVCTGMSNIVYTVDTIAHATSYIWRLPNGKKDTILSNSISVNFDTNTVTTYISVRGRNCYADGDSSVLSVLLNQMPGAATIIYGPDSICEYSCKIFFISPVANATSYIWEPSLCIWPNSVLSDSVAFCFNSNVNTNYISVKASNCMGIGDSTFKIIEKIITPSNAGQIAGLVTAIRGQNNVLYSVPPIANAKYYQWDLPSGYIGQSDSNSILISFSPNAQSGEIKVRGYNSCGYGLYSKLSIYIPTGLWYNTNVFNSYSDVISLKTSGDNVFAGDNKNMYISNNKAINWSSVTNIPGFNNNYYYTYNDFTLVDSIIFAVFNNYGIYKTNNKGNNWQTVNNGLNSLNISKIISGNNHVLAAGTINTLYYSTVNNTVWTPLTNNLPTNDDLTPLAISGDTFYVASPDSLYKSVNGGISWFTINTGATYLYFKSMTIVGNTLYAGTGNGVYISTNGGYSWIPKNNGINGYTVNCISVKDNIIFIGTQSKGVFISTNGGNTWYPINDGLNSMQINALAVIDSAIYAGTGGGLWKRMISDIAYIQGTINAIQGPTNVCKGDTVTFNINPIAGATNNYIWSFPNDALTTINNNNLTVQFNTAADSIELRVKIYGDSIYYSKFINVIAKPEIDNSPEYKYFNLQNGLASNHVRDIDIDNFGNLWIATDDGVSQYLNSTFNNFFNFTVKDILIDNNNIIWMVSDYQLHSYDGTNLLLFDANNSNILGNQYNAIAKDNQNKIWLTTDLGFSKYNGSIWINYTMPNPSNQKITAINVDNSGNVWLSLLNSGVCKFDGSSFQFYNSANCGLLSNSVNKIAFDKLNNVWFATDNGLYMFDGNIWTNYNTLLVGSFSNLWIDDFNNKWFSQYDYIKKFDNTEVKTYYSQGYVNSIITDKIGNCWVGSKYNGLMSLNLNKISGLVNVCQGQSGITYTLSSIPNATSYIWQLPSGVTGSSSTNSISVNFTNTAQSGNISVMAHNNCGNSDTVSFPIVVQNCTGINEVNKTISNLKVFPNPFSNTTTFTYKLKENQKVNLCIYDITGRLVKQLVNENQSQGEHTLSFNAAGLQAGIYYYRLEAGDEVATGKLILSK